MTRLSTHSPYRNIHSGDLIVVTGAGGFIGGHLVKTLLNQGFHRIRAVDIKPLNEWFQRFPGADNRQLDLREKSDCLTACENADLVFNLAADMGGIGFIETNKALCMLSVLINTHMLQAAAQNRVRRFLFASSACVYAADKQVLPAAVPLKESDAYPAMPEDGYGWEKLFSERMCRHFTEDFDLETRVARYHNVYGPNGSWHDGREKAPAAICRKVIEAVLSGRHDIEIWGDGEQTRSFTHIGDCITGTLKLMDSDVREPVNIGSDELVSINELVDIVETIAAINLERRYKLGAPQGVRGRSSDNAFIGRKLGWAPSIPLSEGLRSVYDWIFEQMADKRVAADDTALTVP